MKKLYYLLAGLILATALVSCEKKPTTDLGMDPMDVMKGAKISVTVPEVSIPMSTIEEVDPWVIPGENRGGNRTCAEVADEFSIILDKPVAFDLCGEKVDYEDDEFASGFPAGLHVWIHDGYHVAFDIGGDCLEIGGEYYKVGAVIVKGSNQANVYFYDGGTYFDMGLAAPGDKHMVSNLTFCFVSCDPQEEPPLVIALKSHLEREGYEFPVGVSGGINYDDPHGIHYNIFIPEELNTYDFLLFPSSLENIIGDITAFDWEDGGVHYLEVTVDTDEDEWLFGHTYLYVGSLAGLLDPPPPPLRYSDYPFQQEVESPSPGSRTFTLTYDEIFP